MFKKILVIKLRHIGDVLLTTPVFTALKENFKESFVAVLVNKGTEAVLEKNPFIDEIITFDRRLKNYGVFKKYTEELNFLKQIRKKEFDTTIDLTGGDRAALISVFSGAKVRIGVKSKGFAGKKYFYTHLFEIDGKKHTVLQNLEILEKAGIKVKSRKVLLNVLEEEKEWAKKLIPHKQIVHIHPTSRWLFKCWKDEYIAEVIKWFIEKGFIVVLTSAPTEKEMKKIDSILSFLKPSEQLINLSGRLTLRQLIAVSSISDLFFGVDTAPMHIASALGKPVFALFGPSGAFHWGPWDSDSSEIPYSERSGIQRFGKNIVIQRNWECIPCGQDGCKGSKISKCLFDIKPEEVVEIISSVLSES
ncbi:Lipopolysaccharide heptosyltransferase III [Thermodesulfovibrio sp. N1]|uniref:putative lipopolysaccharide heptosyltransferase III n=1 Tax=Thermodesulfovibrio sp. N1 TaxID=1871110 RepID=UPI00083AF6FF|nr:putative lipopolysaccharide heptosyltransferase III [Thermodesulfovibrio sp. N1]ODA43516.1 Lipopolysaccharide heptosyltransferase III [Thermodesulfovibrio sp. N1]